jgi:hypothetical protein
MGRQLSYYTYERASGTVEPIALADSTTLVVDTAPIGRWNRYPHPRTVLYMEEEGCAKFLAVVEEIKQMVTIIGTGLCILLFNLPLHHSRGGVIYFVPMSKSVASPSLSITRGEGDICHRSFLSGNVEPTRDLDDVSLAYVQIPHLEMTEGGEHCTS